MYQENMYHNKFAVVRLALSKYNRNSLNFVTGGHYYIFISSFIHYVQRIHKKIIHYKTRRKLWSRAAVKTN